MINKKELVNYVVVSFLTIFLVTIVTTNNLVISIKTSMTLLILFLGPGYLISSGIKQIGVIERYLLSILIGFSYTSIYFLLEVLLNLKLTTSLYLIVPSLIYIYFIVKSAMSNKKNKEGTAEN